MKRLFLALFLASTVQLLPAQEDNTAEQGGFKKENLFAGGSLSLSFADNYYQVGGNPVFGYRLNKWAEAGIVVNYIHTSYRYYDQFVDNLRQNLYGGGAFVRAYPLRFLFVHGQLEHNFMALKATPYNGGEPEKFHQRATSLLVGPGYATGREPGGGGTYGYFSVMWDLMDDLYSPYLDRGLYKIPIIRAGIIIPLFQGGNSN